MNTKSIIQGDQPNQCFICGKIGQMERHHIMNGAFRSKSEKYGLVVHLCHNCHNEPPSGVHHNKDVNLWLKRIAQESAMDHYKWSVEEFREQFGKNYI